MWGLCRQNAISTKWELCQFHLWELCRQNAIFINGNSPISTCGNSVVKTRFSSSGNSAVKTRFPPSGNWGLGRRTRGRTWLDLE
ncbi:hypothetical protein L596_025986 [Steinernema carpocapsae]|uniref:Uncharacterized protein n=1 Tax=Steinernema carpocapsae TaxID=34508 RepID=A0A4U5LZZ7_STECR|nr:hypothetical protein L596_025986 [Steinernema carpocapsae]